MDLINTSTGMNIPALAFHARACENAIMMDIWFSSFATPLKAWQLNGKHFDNDILWIYIAMAIEWEAF